MMVSVKKQRAEQHILGAHLIVALAQIAETEDRFGRQQKPIAGICPSSTKVRISVLSR